MRVLLCVVLCPCCCAAASSLVSQQLRGVGSAGCRGCTEGPGCSALPSAWPGGSRQPRSLLHTRPLHPAHPAPCPLHPNLLPSIPFPCFPLQIYLGRLSQATPEGAQACAHFTPANGDRPTTAMGALFATLCLPVPRPIWLPVKFENSCRQTCRKVRLAPINAGGGAKLCGGYQQGAFWPGALKGFAARSPPYDSLL